MYTYYLLAMLLKNDVMDVSMLGSHDLLRVPANRPACMSGEVIIVDERIPSATVLDKLVWVRDYAVSCDVLRERYIKAPKEIVELLGDK